MGRIIVVILVVGLIVGVFARTALRNRRKNADTTPELHKHPERLNQNLDPTDDS